MLQRTPWTAQSILSIIMLALWESTSSSACRSAPCRTCSPPFAGGTLLRLQLTYLCINAMIVSTQATLSKPKAPDASVGGGSAAGSSGPADKPAHDVVAGAMARAASQSTIHPLDTMKVRMQAGVKASSAAASSSGSTAGVQGLAAGLGSQMPGRGLARKLTEVASLYKGVVSAATGAGIIIGAYFAFYSTSKRFLKQRTNLADGELSERCMPLTC